MNKKSRGNAEVGVVIVMVALLLLGLWLYVQVKAFASWASLDVDTCSTMLLRLVLVAALAGMGLKGGFGALVVAALPCALWVCITPALTYWANDYVMLGYSPSTELAWYGRHWIQVVIGLALLGLGGVWYYRKTQ